MQWLNTIVDEIFNKHPEGEILIESGSSPSGTYHLGHLRELVTCDAILLECKRRGREARHIQFVDDLDAFRKVPLNFPSEFEKYLGVPLCDMPAPDDPSSTTADYFLQGLIDACDILGVEVEYIRAHEKYREGFYVPAIERSLERIAEAKKALETISGRELDEHWSPIQVMDENGRLKKRAFVRLDKDAKTIVYKDADNNEQTVNYDDGKVKLDWRLDWPGRWWLQQVMVEPSGRDHMTKGGSYDTGVQIMEDVYEAEPPYAVAYDFINMVGDNKKMSASKGTGLDAVQGAQLMPPEVVRYFILRSPASKRLYFDPINGVVQLMDEFAAFAAKEDKTEEEQQLWYICTRNADSSARSVSQVPFSHLVTSYQASLKDVEKTLEVIGRTEHSNVAEEEADIIKAELTFIDRWLEHNAPEEVKFSLIDLSEVTQLSDAQKSYLAQLAEAIASAPEDADGMWFHQLIYGFKESSELEPKELFITVYQVLIGKNSGPRAGWFLRLLPRDWLIARLKLEK